MHRIQIPTLLVLVQAMMVASHATEPPPGYPEMINTVLENARPLEHPRGSRLPLLLWPVHGTEVRDVALQEQIIRDLDERGIAMIATWNYDRKEETLERALRVARFQQKLGLPVYVNANACMYGFFDGTPETAHIDADGNTFFDESIGGHIGCSFRIDHRYPEMTERIDYFVRAYREAGVPLDFVFGDWEIDGPLDVNRAWEAARRCVVDRRHIEEIDTSFEAFQQAIRIKRAEVTRECYTEPILSRYPKALVGNYGVYPHDGYRYWFDYFEGFVDYHPHKLDQRAPYRKWFDEFERTGYTFAMPVVYTWARIFDWYDYENPDYRWFYNMLRVASNAGQHTPAPVPIIPFVHWHTVFHPSPEEDRVKQMSEDAYQELLWHMLLRGSDTFFMWCPANMAAKEVALVHEVWAAALEYAEWLDGTPVTFDVPKAQGPVVSGLRIGHRVLVRRTDFDDSHPGAVEIKVKHTTISVPRAPGQMQIVGLP